MPLDQVDLGQRERAVADLDGLAQRSCAGLGTREVELVLGRVRENSSGRPGLTGSPWMRLSMRKTYESRWPNSVSIAPGKHVRTPWNTYPPRIDACKSEDVGRDEGEADPYERRVGGSESTGHGNASYVTSGQPGEKRKGESRAGTARRDPRGGGTRLLDPVVEVESTHRQCLRSDAPEGVVVEHNEGVRVQPFGCSGATSGKCTQRIADKKDEGFDESSAWKVSPT